MVARLVPKSRQTQDKATSDSFVNFAAKVGIGTDNLSSANSYGFNPISRIRTLVEWMYRGSWICRNAVDCIADDMTREGVEFGTTLEPKQIEKLQSAFRRQQIWQSLNDVAKWARLYGGCVGYIAIAGQDSKTPLRLETVGKGQFQGITPMDRWMVNPDLVHSIDQPGPDFGLPEFYDVVATSFSFPFPRFRVHHSRLIRMEGISLPYWQKISENMWGISCLEPIYDRLTAFDSVTQGAAQLAYRAYLRTLKVKNLRAIIAAGGTAFQSLVANIELIRRYQANEGVTLLDMEDDFETHQYTFAGLADVLNCMGEQISGATQIPLVRLFGQSPGGLNSSGDSDLKTYYDNILRLQERWFRRPMDVIVRIVAQSEGITLPDGFEYEFKPLWQMTEKEKAEINTADTNAVAAAKDMGMPMAVLFKELRQAGRRTGYWSNITDQDIKDAEEADQVPDPSEMVDPLTGKPLMGHNGGPALEQEESKAGLGLEKDEARIFDWNDLPIHIETRKGEYRRGNGWETLMPVDYGFIAGQPSAEGPFEELDCFVGNALDSDKVWIVDQADPVTGTFDEHKCMLGFKSESAARYAYLRSFSDDWGSERIMGMTQFGLDEFKAWLKDRAVHAPVKDCACAV